jgi:uncharacterized protein (TIGR00251 family)
MAMVEENQHGVVLKVKIQPLARRNGIVGQVGDALKIALTAPAVEGRANDACIDFLAELLKQPRSSITIIVGQKSRNKAIQITGITAPDLRLGLGI